MHIEVATGTGSGPTELAAFDAALFSAGIANYNLIYLSSVIPPDTTVERVPQAHVLQGGWGDRLYVVVAQERISTPNVEAWAGLGWVQDEANGRGLFVEHQGHSEVTVRRDIQQSLEALCATRGITPGEVHMSVTGITCQTAPVCALVAAVYPAEPWS